MEENSITCKNCAHAFTGNFCNNCGQSGIVHRINFKHLLHDLFHAITHLDKGFLFTAREMLRRPGHTVREYIEGKRASHPNPFLMLLIIGGLCSLVYYRYQIKLLTSYKIEDLDAHLHVIDSKFFALLFLGYCFVLSFFDYVFFKYKKYNYTELFLLNIFTATEILLAQLVLVPLWIIGKNWGINDYIRLIVMVIYFIYLAYARYQFFEIKNDLKARKKLTLELLVFLILFVLIGWKTISRVF